MEHVLVGTILLILSSYLKVFRPDIKESLYIKDILLGSHQQMWLWLDDWFSLSLEEVQSLERQVNRQLQRKITESGP
jgi:hypothetical protein